MKIFLPLCFFLVLTSVTSAQRSNGLTVEGNVKVEQGSVDGAVIQILRDNQPLDNYGIGADGNYKLELDYNHEFALIFTRQDNFPQKIVVNTRVPVQVLRKNPFFPPFVVNINLFTEISGIDRTFSENTVLKIYYSESVDNFISDLYYNDAQIKHLIDQAILQAEMIDKEADYLSLLTKAELAELKREYDQLIKEAESEYNNEQFLSALDGYKAASRIFPSEQYPKDRIAEINDLLGMMMVASQMQQALAQRLETLLKQGDRYFEQEQYEEARNSYQRALSVDNNNSHAAGRIEQINNILKQRRTEQEYQNYITSADNAFNELLYAEAEKSYKLALELKPGES
ncbi:MAG: tetratricopeptide repeat protein, partial [Prolixibacteraceae bacterium]|nr:tetratricopeptide repeat protein [Prolixibacteraceae bacterium]